MKTTKTKAIHKIIKDKRLRVAYFEHDFFNFCLFYFTETFGFNSADFQKQYCKGLQGGNNIIFNGFRESGKTVLFKYFIIRCIVYEKHRYIVFFCDESKKAQDKILDVAKQLQGNTRLINDYGQLFHEVDNKVSTKKRIGDFETSNNIKVEAMGMGEIFRGKVYGVPGKGEQRPTLVGFDDIDTRKSVNTVDQIEKNYMYIKNEVYGGLGDGSQVVFLYNTIKEDGVGPRLKKDHSGQDQRKYFHVPIIENGVITRHQRYTLEDIETKRKSSGEISFNQNYMLIPYSGGDSIVKRSMIQYHNKTEGFERVVIAIDPAISTKEQSDLFAICVTGTIEDKYYVLDCIGLHGEQKEIVSAVTIIKNIYTKRGANYVIVESVAFQKVMSRILANNGLAVKEVQPHKDKVTRLLEKEHLFSQGRVFFNNQCSELVEDILVFPNGKYDDRVDALVYSLEEDQDIDIYIG